MANVEDAACESVSANRGRPRPTGLRRSSDSGTTSSRVSLEEPENNSDDYSVYLCIVRLLQYSRHQLLVIRFHTEIGISP